MALVQYSDSESESDDIQEIPPRPTKKPRQNGTTSAQQSSSLPPLPAAFHDLYASSTRVSVRDDPSLHGGRKRVIPHVEGNWPTHLYLEWYPSKEEVGILNDIVSCSGDRSSNNSMDIHSLLQSDLGAQLPLHISLSRPVVLRTEQKQLFIEAFEAAIKNSHIPPFHATLENLKWVSNYEKTRWFLVLSVKKPEHDNLNRLLKVSNRSLSPFGQPPLYETSLRSSHADDYSHCFHISLAWSLTEPSPKDIERVASIDLQSLKEFKILFDRVKAKIGNNISSLQLSTGITHEKNIGGL